MKFYRLKSPFDYIKRIFRTVINTIFYSLPFSYILLELGNINWIIYFFCFYIIIFHLIPYLIQCHSIEFKQDLIVFNYFNSSEQLLLNNIKVALLPVLFKFYGAKKKLIFNFQNDNRKVIVNDYWSDYKDLKEYLLANKYLDYQKEEEKIQVEKKTNRLIHLHIFIAFFITFIFTIFILFVFDISDKSFTLYSIIFSIIIATIFSLVARKHPKFKEYRKQVYDK